MCYPLDTLMIKLNVLAWKWSYTSIVVEGFLYVALDCNYIYSYIYMYLNHVIVT